MSNEIASLARENIEPMEVKYPSMLARAEKIAPAGDPKLKQIEEICNDGVMLVKKALLVLDTGDADTALDFMSQIFEKYNEGEAILRELTAQFVLPEAGTLSLVDEFDLLFPDGVGKHGNLAKTLESLHQLVQDLEKETNNPFFTRSKNALGVESISVVFPKINEGRDITAALRNPFMSQLPGFNAYLDKVEQRLSKIASTDKEGTHFNGLQQNMKDMKGNFDWKPLRILGALGATVVTSFVGIQSIITGTLPSWVALPWVGLLALSVRPDIAFQSVQRAQLIHELPSTSKELNVLRQFKDPKGVEAFEQIIDLYKKGKLKDVLKLNRLNSAQVNMFAGEGTELAEKLLTETNEVERITTLRILAKQVQYGNEDAIRGLLQTP